jgi:hypothetical protein
MGSAIHSPSYTRANEKVIDNPANIKEDDGYGSEKHVEIPTQFKVVFGGLY